MAAEDSTEQTIANRILAGIERLHDGYDAVTGRIRTYTPYVVQTVEVVLAIALIALLIHWFYLYYVV